MQVLSDHEIEFIEKATGKSLRQLREEDEMVRLISQELKKFPKIELTKIAIEFFCKNLQRHKYSTKEKEELVRYFNKRLHMKVEWNQTS